MPISCLLMRSFLSYVAVCDFTKKELHHFRMALKGTLMQI